MKKTTLAAIIAFTAQLAFSVNAGASLAVYSYTGTTTTTGGGKTLSTRHIGTMVIDLDTMSVTYVGQFSTGSGKTLKNYWVNAPLSDAINTQVLGANGASSTVLAIVQNPGSRYTGSVAHFESAIGLNSRLTIRNKGTTETAILPRALSSPSFVITEDSTYDYVAQSTGTYTFNSAATLGYNNAQKTFSAVITELENAYKSKKFTQWLATNLVGIPTPPPAPQVSTVAGSGNNAFADGQGTSASFSFPYGVAVDPNGNAYVGDSTNNRIRKITASGNVTTLAGSSWAFADGQGTAAKFKTPYGVAVDKNANVYVADCGNNRIRKITPNGNVTTLAGFGVAGYADGQGVLTNFNAPIGVAVDAIGNVYVADYGNHRIRKITPSGNVTTLAGSGIASYADGQGTGASFNYPSGVAVDASGNIYVGDQQNNRIRKITPNGNVTTLAGFGVAGYADGQGVLTNFNAPIGVAVDAIGNVYVADYGNHRIRKITPSGNVTTLAGSGYKDTSGVGTYSDGSTTSASFNVPSGVAVDGSGNVYVADMWNNRIRKITISK